MFFDKIVSVQRITQLEDNPNKGEYQAVSGLESVSVNVQPANPETVALVNGVFGKTYDIYTTQSGIRDGDKLTISGTFIDGITQNKALRVSSVANWWFGPLPHFELVCADIQ